MNPCWEGGMDRTGMSMRLGFEELLVQGGALICGRMEPLHETLPKNTVNAAFELTSLISYNTPRSSSNSNQDFQAVRVHPVLH